MVQPELTPLASRCKRLLRSLVFVGVGAIAVLLAQPLLQDATFWLGWQQPSRDYGELEQLLKAENWADADLETTWAIIQLTHIKNPFSISETSISRLPCADLKAMDQLWRQYSHERFGFSVQREIWQAVQDELLNQTSSSQTYWMGRIEFMQHFTQRVGRGINGPKPEFNLQAPAGYLPSWGVLMKAPHGDFPGQFIPFSTPAFTERMNWCRL